MNISGYFIIADASMRPMAVRNRMPIIRQLLTDKRMSKRLSVEEKGSKNKQNYEKENTIRLAYPSDGGMMQDRRRTWNVKNDTT